MVEEPKPGQQMRLIVEARLFKPTANRPHDGFIRGFERWLFRSARQIESSLVKARTIQGHAQKRSHRWPIARSTGQEPVDQAGFSQVPERGRRRTLLHEADERHESE